MEQQQFVNGDSQHSWALEDNSLAAIAISIPADSDSVSVHMLPVSASDVHLALSAVTKAQ